MPATQSLSMRSRRLARELGWQRSRVTIGALATGLAILSTCGAAHLRNELCLQHFDQDLGLRSRNMQELLAADRKIWNLISELYSRL